MRTVAKRRRCKICKELFPPFNSFDVVCGVPCALEAIKDKDMDRVQRERFKKDTAKSDRAAVREFNQNDRGWWENKAKEAFNKYIRIRDRGKPCISCDKPDNGGHQRHASHYRPAHMNSALKFDETNVHASCQQCNSSKSGNLTPYRRSLVHMLGLAAVEALDNNHEKKRWEIDELREITTKYRRLSEEAL